MGIREEMLRDGYCIIPNILEPEFINELIENFKGRIAEQKSEFATISMDRRPLYLKLYKHPNIIHALRETLRCPDPKYWSAYFINKNPNEGRRPWHHDWWGWNDPMSRCYAGPQLGLMFYWTPTNEHNGALDVIPGSHRNWWVDDFTLHEHWFAEHPKAKSVYANPGDLVIVDARTLHATRSNNTREPRMMCTLWYYTDWANMTPEFRANKAIRDVGFMKDLGDLCPICDEPAGDYKKRNHPVREDMLPVLEKDVQE